MRRPRRRNTLNSYPSPSRGRLGGGGERKFAIDRLKTLPAPTQPPPEGEG